MSVAVESSTCFVLIESDHIGLVCLFATPTLTFITGPIEISRRGRIRNTTIKPTAGTQKRMCACTHARTHFPPPLQPRYNPISHTTLRCVAKWGPAPSLPLSH
ncbi:hypothetical protein H920_14329 [Fukomys damarensis]|uniref:Uncharacterized protein n=1 Tax=Fukomys damarensis TaxID=885580 RepID=A0A091CWV4_FUKDA|nr:hypothetical protein H920_14329 [Fukomys damarensis]